MNLLPRPAFLATLVVLLLAAGIVSPAAGKNKKMKEKETGTVPVMEWLVLGPEPAPFPAFHAEKPGSFGIKEMLAADRFPAGPLWPAAGESGWQTRKAGREGLVELGKPESLDGPAEAWLATYISTDEWRSLKIKARGGNPLKIYLDGEAVADGGYAAPKDQDEPATVDGKLKLDPGKHLLMIRTVLDPVRQSDWQAGAELLEADGTVLTLDRTRNMTIGDILDAPVPSSARVAPDGSLVAYTVRQGIHGTDKAETWIEIRSLPAGELVRKLRGGEGKAKLAWAPDGHRLSYVSRRSDDKTASLWVHDLDGGDVTPVLERIEDFRGYAWCPTGKAVAYWTTAKYEKNKSGIKQVLGLEDRQPRDRDLSHISIVNLEDGVRRRLTAGQESTSFHAFSPDVGKILFTRNFEELGRPSFSRGELWQIDLATHDSRKLRDFGWLVSADYSPDGSRLLLIGGPSLFGEAGENVPDAVIPNNYDGQLYMWDPKGEEPESVQAVTREFDPAVKSAVWHRGDGKVYIHAEDGEFERLVRYDPETKTYKTIQLPFEVASQIAHARDVPVAVAIGSSMWSPPRVAAVHLGREAARVIHAPAENWFQPVRMGGSEDFAFTAANGRTIAGRLYFPPGLDRDKKYPAIVYYYGGTSPVGRGFGGRYPKEYWASRGYVVYVLQPSGATGFGQEFSAAHVNDWGTTTTDEIIAGTGKMLEAFPFVDAERVGCIGASYGGFMTMNLLTRTDMFAAAVSHAGISGLASYWGEGYWGAAYSTVATAGSYPWNRRDIYVENSPIFHADKVVTPILLTHGTSDPNVPPGESDQFFTALRILGKEVQYLRVDGQEHWVLDHAKRLQWSASIVAWFDRWLKDSRSWWDALYPAPGGDEKGNGD